MLGGLLHENFEANVTMTKVIIIIFGGGGGNHFHGAKCTMLPIKKNLETNKCIHSHIKTMKLRNKMSAVCSIFLTFFAPWSASPNADPRLSMED